MSDTKDKPDKDRKPGDLGIVIKTDKPIVPVPVKRGA